MSELRLTWHALQHISYWAVRFSTLRRASRIGSSDAANHREQPSTNFGIAGEIPCKRSDRDPLPWSRAFILAAHLPHHPKYGLSRADLESTGGDRSSLPASWRFRSVGESLQRAQFADFPKEYVLYPRAATRNRSGEGAGEALRASSNDHGLLPCVGRQSA